MINRFWILTLTRSGSSYLTNILLNLNTNYHIEESFLSDDRFITKEEFIKNPIPIAKVPREHFTNVFSNEDKPMIESLLPGIKYILLKRNDTIAITVSRYIATKTNTWYANSPNCQFPYIKVDEKELLKAHENTLQFIEGWRSFLKKNHYLSVDFDYMIQNPIETIKTILHYLEHPTPKTLHLQHSNFMCPQPRHPQHDEIRKILKSKLRTIL